MKIIFWWRLARFSLLVLASLSLVTATQAATYYVSPSGSDADSGILTAPFATLQRAVNLANPGDTIYLRGGTYTLSSQTVISRSGDSANLIKVLNYPSEVPILDGISLTNAGYSIIRLNSASWWQIQGLEIKNAPAHGIYLIGTSSNNIIERNVLHHNTRIQLNGAGITVVDTGANNLILNNDSHHNGVLGSSGGDGIGVNYTHGPGNVVRGNRVWRNNDDGIDLWDAANVLVENNWSWENGKKDDLTPSGGNGVGYKLGGSGIGDGLHTVRSNLAWRNQYVGFSDNSADLPMNVFNNTGYENGVSNFSFYHPVAYVLRNNLSIPNSLTYILSPTLQISNSWNLSVTVSAADFMSLDFSGVTGPRNADGSLPTINFLKLVAGSNLIDKGVDVGLPYSGSSPDLGAYEYALSADTQAPTTPTALTATAISNSQIDLSWTASTDNVGVVGYDVYRGGVKIGTTASTTYSSTGLTAATTYSYTITAFDAAGNTSPPSTSASATTTAPPLDTTPPTVSIASPTGGTVSATIAVSVNAADNVGVTRVDLRVNGATVASTNVAPYQFAWNSTTVPNGPVALTAVAFDAAGNSTTSATIALDVSNGPPPDTTPPTVSIASPTGGTVSNTVAVSVNAADNVGVTRVELRVNGVTVGSGTAPPWQFSWDSRTVADGPVLLTAIAYDAAGNSAESFVVTVTASNASGNVALASAGAVASASSTYSAAYPVAAVNDNERAGVNWGNGGGWRAAGTAPPDRVQINFNGTKTIDRVVVYTVQDNYINPIEPTDSLTFALYGITDFTVEGWNGSAWVTLGTVSGNNLVKRTVSFAAFTTNQIRVNITNSLNLVPCITEIEAWGIDAAASLLNGSFEIPALGSSYQYGPNVAEIGWTFSGGSGIEGNDSAWGAASAPDGTQAAFIQDTGKIAQTFNLNPGSYTLSFQAAQRSCCISPYAQPIKVGVDGVQIGSLVSPQSTSFAVFSIPFTVSTTGPHTIEFAGTDPIDNTTFIDAVMLAPSSIGTTESSPQ